MFSKAKRFEDKPVGCGADAIYDPKKVGSTVGGVIPKTDRFADLKNIGSDTESVHSDKSSQVFRTPIPVRRIPGTPTHKKTKCDPPSRELFEELLIAKSVELQNKDDTIRDYETQMKDMRGKIFDLQNELADLKLEFENIDSVLKEERDLSKENISKLEVELKTKENEFIEIEERLLKLTEEIKVLQDDRKILESFLVEFVEVPDTDVSLNDKIAKIKEIFADKAKAVATLEKCKQNLESQNKKMKQDIDDINGRHAIEIKTLEEGFSNQIKHLNENAAEKIRLCEIQFEERYRDLESYAEYQLNQEIRGKQEELRRCQELTEKEILQSELQMNELNSALENNLMKVNQLSDIIDELKNEINSKDVIIEQLKSNLSSSESHMASQKESYESQICALKTDVDKLSREKNVFALTLETHQQTLQVISKRLRNSDEDVESFKEKLQTAVDLNKLYESEIVELQVEYNNFQDEYKQLLMSIVNSKVALDKSHEEILSTNAKVTEYLDHLKDELTENVSAVKVEMLKDVDCFKRETMNTVAELQSKYKIKESQYGDIRTKCDEAYSKLRDCQSLLSLAEAQMELKDQELNELGTENDRLSGTLAAMEQEKNELETLIREFVHLAKEKDFKIAERSKKIEKCEDEIYDQKCQITSLNQMLEATDFIVKEKDCELNKLKARLETAELDHQTIESKLQQYEEKLESVESTNDKYEDLKLLLEQTNKEMDKKDAIMLQLESELSICNMHMETCDSEALRNHCDGIEKELAEMTRKYTELLGHKNYKQKIKHINDLKAQNIALKEDNEKLHATATKQSALIEKLKRDLECTLVLKSPLVQKKQILHANSPHGKENSVNGSPLTQSPNRASPLASRPNTPLRDLNR